MGNSLGRVHIWYTGRGAYRALAHGDSRKGSERSAGHASLEEGAQALRPGGCVQAAGYHGAAAAWLPVLPQLRGRARSTWSGGHRLAWSSPPGLGWRVYSQHSTAE